MAKGYDKARYAALRAAGKCVQCKADAEDGKSRCRKCRATVNANGRKWQRRLGAARYSAGLCAKCGERSPRDEGVITCGECLAKAAALLKKYRGIDGHERARESDKTRPAVPDTKDVHHSPGRYLSPAITGRE